MDNSRPPVSLTLYNKIQDGGGFLRYVTENLKASWRRSIRSIGGYWLGSARWNGSEAEMLDIFLNGLGLEIREYAGQLMTWQGYLTDMELTLNGQTYNRSLGEVANRIKTIYSKIGNNLIDNPSCESSVWSAYNTPATRERSTTWASEGSYSAHVVANSVNDGVVIDSSIALNARLEYMGHVSVSILSGTWRLEIYRVSGGAVLDHMEISEAGQWVMSVNVPSETLPAATTVGMRLFCTTASGEIYADAAVMQLAPVRAETTWYQNAVSQSEWGVIEHVLLEAGMTDAAANAKARKTLLDLAWPEVMPPTRISPDDRPDKTRLELIFSGYVATLANRHIVSSVSDTASALISTLLSYAQYVRTGTVQTNNLAYQIEDREAYRVWDLIRDIIRAGDADGDLWTGGVYQDRYFHYRQASDMPVARLRDGELLNPGGGRLEGWLAEPGYVALDDIQGAAAIYTGRESTRGYAWMGQVEFDLGEWFKSGRGVTYTRTNR